MRAKADKEREQDVGKGEHKRNTKDALCFVRRGPVQMHDFSLIPGDVMIDFEALSVSTGNLKRIA